MSLHPEDIAATALARWLEERGAPPEELDDEVLEAVYALRPDLAPPPTVTIDEILATLDQAQPLAAWLDRDGEAPESLDDDVAEAIYALQPDRAPGPKVSIDDILGRLTAGPLAATAAAPEEHLAEIVQFPARPQTMPEPANVVAPSFQGRPFGQERRKGRWLPWVVGSGAMSAMAAAALLAVVALPTIVSSPSGSPALESSAPAPMTVGEMREEPASIPSPAEEAPPELTAQAAPAKDAASLEAPLAKAPTTPASGWWEGQAPGGSAATRTADAPVDQVAAGPAAAPPPPPIAASPAPLAPPEEEEAVADLFDGDDATEADFARERAQSETSAGLFGGREAGEEAYDEDLSARGGSAPIIVSESKKEKAAKPSSAPRRSASASNSNVSIPEAAYEVPASTTTGTTAAATDPLLANESQAAAYAAQGRYADAARTISANIVTPASVGHKYAAQATRWYLQAGRADLAATTCDLGLALGATPSAELSSACDAAWAANRPAVDSTGH